MGRIAVAQSMGRDAAVIPTQIAYGSLDNALRRRLGHGFIGGCSLLVIASFVGEYPEWITMGGPVLSHEFERLGSHWDQAIFVAFASPNVDQHAIGIDVGNLQMKRFLHAQAHRVDSPEECVMARPFDRLKQLPRLFDGKHSWQFHHIFDAQEFESLPIPNTSVLEEELDARVSDFNRAWFPELIVSDVVEVSSQFLFIDEVRAFACESSQFPNGS